MIIRNYGLYWKREDVQWGSPGLGNQGTLLGRNVASKKGIAIDFRQQAGIYILQDSFRAIYIGQAGSKVSRLFGRLRGHTRNHLAERWDRFSWFGIYPVKSNVIDVAFNVEKVRTDIYSILNHLEGALISVTEPPLNRQGARFGDAEQYIQVRSDVSTEDYEETFEE